MADLRSWVAWEESYRQPFSRVYPAEGGIDPSPCDERPISITQAVRGCPRIPPYPSAWLIDLTNAFSTPCLAMLASVDLCAIIAAAHDLAD